MTADAWRTTVVAPWARWVLLLVIIVFGGAAVATLGDPHAGALVALGLVILGALVVAATLTVARIDVTVDDTGLTIVYGPWHWPVQHVARADIASVEEMQLRALRFGGVGYRWIPWTRESGPVLMSGPGLAVHRRDGRTLVVSLPQAGEAVSRLRPDARP